MRPRDGSAGNRTSRNMTRGQTPNCRHSPRHTPASFGTTNAQYGACKIPMTSVMPLTSSKIHGEERFADAASWRGPEGVRRRRASDPFRIHTTSHAHTARSRVRPILTPSSS